MTEMKYLAAFSLFLLMTACSPEPGNTDSPIKVEIVKTDSGYQLLRGGEPYVIRGAGMGRDDIERFAAHGGNSIRTWSTNNDYQDTRELLDTAQANGVTVALGLSMTAERHGFDYEDPDAVEAQLAKIRDRLDAWQTIIPAQVQIRQIGQVLERREIGDRIIMDVQVLEGGQSCER